MNKINVFRLLLFLILASFLANCSNSISTFDPEVIDRIKDKNLPEVFLLSPENNSAYSQTVTITGEVVDDGEELPVLTYSVTDEAGLMEKTGEIITIAEEAVSGVAGSFSFSFTTHEYTSDIIVSVIANDWNGNIDDTETLRLVYSGSTLPSLSVIPGNKEVFLSWEEVGSADEYTIFYNNDGTLFNESTAESFSLSAADYDSAVPVVLTATEHGIANSTLCSVKVKASSSEEDEWSSGVLKTLPLSSFSLIPKTDCFEDKIVLDWRPARGGVSYQVWRSDTGESGNYELISGSSLTEPFFMDTQVEEGRRYHYRVGAEENAIRLSAPVSAETTSIKTSGSAGIYRTLKNDNVVGIDTSNTVAFGVSYDTTEDTVDIIAVDISTPTSPVELSRTQWNPPVESPNLGRVYDIVVSDSTAFVSVYYTNPITYAVIAFDISNPEQIAEITEVDLSWLSTSSGRPLDLEIDADRNLLYIALDSYGIACVDLTEEPDSWQPVVASGWGSGRAFDLAYSGNYVYGANLSDGITVADFTDSTSPTIGSTIPVSSVEDADVYTAIDVDSTENLLVMVSEHNDPDSAYYHGGVWVMDISTPGIPVEEGYTDMEIPFKDVKLEGTHAFCSTGNGGVRMIDVTDPAGIFERISYDTVGSSESLQLFSSGIAVADGNGGVSVVLPPDIENPAILGVTDASQTYGSFVKEDILYIAGKFGFYSLQVESDGSLVSLTANGDADSGDVVVMGDYAFIAAGALESQELFVIDVSDPNDLSNAISIDCENRPMYMDYWGDYLYLGEGNAGVEVFDISEPEAPVSLGLIPVNRDARIVATFRDRLYVADYAYGLLVYDIEDPTNPVFLNDFYDEASVERQVYSINVSGNHVYACMEDYVHILSTEEVNQWVGADTGTSDFGSAIGWFDFPSYSSNIQVEGDFFYAVTFGGSLEIYSIQNPEAPSKLFDSGSGFFTISNQYSLEVQGNHLYANNHYKLYNVSLME